MKIYTMRKHCEFEKLVIEMRPSAYAIMHSALQGRILFLQVKCFVDIAMFRSILLRSFMQLTSCWQKLQLLAS